LKKRSLVVDKMSILRTKLYKNSGCGSMRLAAPNIVAADLSQFCILAEKRKGDRQIITNSFFWLLITIFHFFSPSKLLIFLQSPLPPDL
jgi:hypothetical protein